MVTKVSDGNDPRITSEAIPMVEPGSNNDHATSLCIRTLKTAMGYDSLVNTHLTVKQLDLAGIPNTYIVARDDVQLISVVEPPGVTRTSERIIELTCSSCPGTWGEPSVTTQYALQVTSLD